MNHGRQRFTAEPDEVTFTPADRPLDRLLRLWREVRQDIAPDRGATAVTRLLRARGSARLHELRFTLDRAGVPADQQMPLLAQLVATGAIREGEFDEYLPGAPGPDQAGTNPADRRQTRQPEQTPGRRPTPHNANAEPRRG